MIVGVERVVINRLGLNLSERPRRRARHCYTKLGWLFKLGVSEVILGHIVAQTPSKEEKVPSRLVVVIRLRRPEPIAGPTRLAALYGLHEITIAGFQHATWVLVPRRKIRAAVYSEYTPLVGAFGGIRIIQTTAGVIYDVRVSGRVTS